MKPENNYIHRVQSLETENNPYFNRHLPIRRVIVSGDGDIEFNPDGHKYIYFSKTPKHHCYYIYTKVLKIINDELRFARENPEFAKLDLPDNIGKYLPGRCNSLQYYTNMNVNVIRNVQNLFRNYIPPKFVELVSLKYLNSFSSLIDDCVVRNSRKYKSNGPEVSDQSVYKGAYGINDAWLDLLKCSIVSSKTSKLSMDRFFWFLLDESFFGRSSRARLEELQDEKGFFKILETMTYTELDNPRLFDKNNPNDVIKHIDTIEDRHLYDPNITLDADYFRKTKLDFKQEIRQVRDEHDM